MTTIEIINHILEMDKELENLRNKIRLLEIKKRVCTCENASTDDEKPRMHSETEEFIYNYGINSLYDKVIYSWQGVHAKRNKNGEVEYTPFDNFVKDSINYNSIPSALSRDEVITLLDEKLKYTYEEKCKEAYQSLIELEQKEKGEE